MRAGWRPGTSLLGRGLRLLEEGVQAITFLLQAGDLGLCAGEGGLSLGERQPESCDLAGLALAVSRLAFCMGLGHTAPQVRGLRHVTFLISSRDYRARRPHSRSFVT